MPDGWSNYTTYHFFFLSTDACGGYIDQANGTLQSPSFPELYPPNKNCVWQIAAPEQYRITLNFTHFDLEGNNVREFLLYKEKMSCTPEKVLFAAYLIYLSGIRW